jgi:acetyl esterase/lipase
VTEQGYVVASIQYRTTVNGATYSDAVQDVKSAIRYLRAHAAQYGIDVSKVAVWGQSAGGYLAAMTGTTNGDSRFDVGANLGQRSDVQAVVDEFGPSDLAKLAADYDTATQQANYAPGNALAQWVFGSGSKKSILDGPAAAVAAADPITYISSATPPFVELQGSHDQLVSPSQTLLLNNALKAKGIPSTRYLIEGAGHGDISVTGATSTTHDWSTQKVMNLIVSFLRQHLSS